MKQVLIKRLLKQEDSTNKIPFERLKKEGLSPLSQEYIDKRQIDELATTGFLKNGENVGFFGPSGIGKTHLASTLSLVLSTVLH